VPCAGAQASRLSIAHVFYKRFSVREGVTPSTWDHTHNCCSAPSVLPCAEHATVSGTRCGLLRCPCWSVICTQSIMSCIVQPHCVAKSLVHQHFV
jgi:hypothetical protein